MKRLAALLVALLLALSAVSAVDYWSAAFEPLQQVPPLYDAYFVSRSVALFVISALFLYAAKPTFLDEPFELESVRFRLWVSATTGLCLAFAGLFWIGRWQFSMLSREDGLVEWASAYALLAACALFVYDAVYQLRSASAFRRRRFLVSSLLAGVFFVIAMEEVSWLQRTIGYGTPDFLSENVQREANFHNLATPLFETAYYVGGFFFLILLPFLGHHIRGSSWAAGLERYLPHRAVAFGAAPLVAFNWDMWNIALIQVSFFITIMLVARSLWAAVPTPRAERTILIGVMSALLFAQTTFLVRGDLQFRHWEVTEYKELFIALGFLAYAAIVVARSRTI